jgi:hypothetical protein
MIAKKAVETPEVFAICCPWRPRFRGAASASLLRLAGKRSSRPGWIEEFAPKARIPNALALKNSAARTGRIAAMRVAIGCLALASAVLVETAPWRKSIAASTPSEQRVLTYSWGAIWKGAVRYLRVDRKYRIVEKDESSGFILFEYPLSNEQFGSGSVELVELVANREVRVRVVVRLNQGPMHLTYAIADGIAAKLRAEHGPPPPPRRAPDDKSPSDPDEAEGDTSGDDHSL